MDFNEIKKVLPVELDFGVKVKDVISGQTGIINGIHFYMNGCVRLSVQPQKKKDGTTCNLFTEDYQQLQVIKSKKVVLPYPIAKKIKKRPPNGPMPTPERR